MTIGGTCYDKMFSGHLSFGLFTTLFLFKNNLLESTFFNKMLFILINIIHFFIIAIIRSHYTIDLIVSFFITTFVYNYIK